MDLDTTGLHRSTRPYTAFHKKTSSLYETWADPSIMLSEKKTGQQISEYVTKMILIDIENYNTLGLRDCSFFYFDFGFENKELNI